MTTLIEEDQETGTGNGTPDWAAGYDMPIPCVVEGCPEDVMWLGNQHGCLKAFSCDNHTMRFVSAIRGDISRNGFTHCNYCNKTFDTLESFFTAVRI